MRVIWKVIAFATMVATAIASVLCSSTVLDALTEQQTE
jgi:hypothetical protein